METKLIEHKKSKSNNWVRLDIRNRNSESKISVISSEETADYIKESNI